MSIFSILFGAGKRIDGDNAQKEWKQKTLSYAKEVNAYVKKGYLQNWENMGKQPKEVELEHLAAAAIVAVRKANKEKSFDFFCYGVGVDTMLIASVTTFESDTPEMTFFIPTIPKTNTLGKIFCPKCKRTDKVYKIRYGDNPTYVRHINASGNTTYSPLYKGTYQEDCTERPAKYYCDRDKIKF